MVNLRSNQLACRAADRAIQIHGGVGYSRHKQFEHIYRHHRRYRITEGTDELQLRRIASRMFDFSSPR
jgi:alkylation response protein AidB-like acyl-CoA dehydrogenase